MLFVVFWSEYWKDWFSARFGYLEKEQVQSSQPLEERILGLVVNCPSSGDIQAPKFATVEIF